MLISTFASRLIASEMMCDSSSFHSSSFELPYQPDCSPAMIWKLLSPEAIVPVSACASGR
jgi:hypothetical protein